MVIFIDKVTGRVEGTIEGRIHTPQQMNMWVGDKEKTLRIVVDWKAVNERFEVVEKQIVEGYHIDEEGFDVPTYRTVKQKIKKVDYEPDHPQKQLFSDIAEGKKSIHYYKYDFKTKKFVKLTKKEYEQ